MHALMLLFLPIGIPSEAELRWCFHLPEIRVCDAAYVQAIRDLNQARQQLQYVQMHSIWREEEARAVLSAATRLYTIWDLARALRCHGVYFESSLKSWQASLAGLVDPDELRLGVLPLPLGWRQGQDRSD